MYSKNVIHAINCFRNSGAVLKNSNPGQPEWEFAYSEECRLFNEFFPNFTREEHARYAGFVQWLGRTGLSSSDLTTEELIEIYNIHNMTNQLQSGNYMNAKHVIETLNHRFCRPTLASIAEKVCKKHQGEHGIYFNTTDLKNIMMPDLFKELECEVTTHMITE